uniref:Phytol kinase n=1 Tax=Paulinella micropora TaxID=1928728 RepID=A0A385I098_9EUKA|nr:hypothetical protein PMNZ_388 [Paulinella micropora]AXY63331.1 hypothetical protein PMNZ_388 [Paulinella micropora]
MNPNSSSLNIVILGLILLTAWFLILYLAGIVLYQKWPYQKEWMRKLLHIGTGPVILIAWITSIPRTINLGIGILTISSILVNYRLMLIPIIEAIDRRSYGTLAYGLAVTILLWFYWPKEPTSIMAGLMVMGFGDGLAGLLGSTFSSPCWRVWGQRKSIIGTLTMLLVSIMVLVILSTFSSMPINYKGIINLAVIATILEQLAISGWDNLIIPLVISYLWQVCILPLN